MSITDKTKNKIIDYIVDKGHLIMGEPSNVKTSSWEIVCGVCSESNQICVNNLTVIVNNFGDITCSNCKFNKKVEKFLARSNMQLVDDYCEMRQAWIGCKDCGLCYEYSGDYQDNYKCYCRLTIKQTEHKLYKWLSESFEDSVLSKEVRVFGSHKVDIQIRMDDKIFIIEVDDPGHFNPNTSQGRKDIECVKEFLEDEVEDCYLVHINEDDVYKQDSLKLLFTWITCHLENIPVENMLLIDSSGKNRYKYLDLPDLSKYHKNSYKEFF